MSLSEAFASTPNGRTMRVDVVLSELSKADAETLREALSNPKVTGYQIETALKKLTPPITCSPTAVTNWRAENGVTS